MQPFFYGAHPVRVIFGFGTLAQLPAEVERRHRDFMVLPGEDPKEPTKPEDAWKLIEPWGMTPENATLERNAVYRFQARWATEWRQGRCLIAGDAAHSPPRPQLQPLNA